MSIPFTAETIRSSVAALSHILPSDLELDLDDDECVKDYELGSWCRVESRKDDRFEVFVYRNWEEVVRWHVSTIRMDIENEECEELPLSLKELIPLVAKRCNLGELEHMIIANGRDLVYLGNLKEEDFPGYCKDPLKALFDHFDGDEEDVVTTLMSQCRPDLDLIAGDVLKAIGGVGYYMDSSMGYFKTPEGFYVGTENVHTSVVLSKHAKPVDCVHEEGNSMAVTGAEVSGKEDR
jgi:hypothetical protein